MKGREKYYHKATKERLIELLEKIGYKVTPQSSDGTWMLIRLPDGTPTDYWIFSDRVEHRMGDFRGAAWFSYDCCKLVIDNDLTTVSIIAKGAAHNGIFISWHNFESHRLSSKKEAK